MLSQSRNSTLRRLLIYLCLLLAVLPSLVWISLDQRVWPWDQAWYGQVSVELFHTLIHSPQQWIMAMLAAFGTKAPGVAWIGQFFVPLGALIQSIDTGLLLSVVTTQFLTLLLTFKSIEALTKGKSLVALSASLTIASAPLFVGMSQQYLVEPVQTLAVAWFILTMSLAPQWQRGLILSNLLGATSLAMLVKITSPLYCLGPGLIALTYLLCPQLRVDRLTTTLKPTTKSDYTVLGLATILAIGAMGWYAKNLAQVVQFAIYASSGSGAELYGKRDVFLNKLFYWLEAAQRSFFFPGVAVVLSLVLVVGLLHYFLREKVKLSHFSVCALVGLLHILFVLALFSVNIGQDNRYLLPLIPHLAILVAWGLAQINRRLVTSFVCLTLTIQLMAVHAQALGLISPNSSVSYWLYSVDHDRNPADDLRQVVRETCTKSSRERYNIIGVERPWLNANSAAYFSAKLREPQGLRCYYTSLGYAEANVGKAWQRLLDLRIAYFVTLRRDRQPLASDPFNQISLPTLEKVQTSNAFKLQSSIDRSGILLYRNLKDLP